MAKTNTRSSTAQDNRSHDMRQDHSDTQGVKQGQFNQENKELLKDLRSADAIYFGEFEALNNSGVNGTALITVDYGKANTSADDLMTVRIMASGLDAGVHLQHMHGFETGQDAVTPDKDDDTDGDGYVELLEGIGDYGPILLNLDDANGGFPTTADEGSYVFKQTYHLQGDSAPHASHAGDTITTFEDLDLNHLVIHGMFVPENAGQGTPGEVGNLETSGISFDPDTYKEVLPVAVAELESATFREARDMLSDWSSDGALFG